MPKPAHGGSELNPKARTAVILVNGYNGLGLHTVLQVPRMFGDTFRNFVFIHVGAVDAGNFKGAAEIEALRIHTEEGAARYVAWARAHSYGAAALTSVSADVMGEVMRLARLADEQFPNKIFFAGQLLFTNETRLTRWLHNHTAFSLQRRFFLANLPFVVLPIRVGYESVFAPLNAGLRRDNFCIDVPPSGTRGKNCPKSGSNRHSF